MNTWVRLLCLGLRRRVRRLVIGRWVRVILFVATVVIAGWVSGTRVVIFKGRVLIVRGFLLSILVRLCLMRLSRLMILLMNRL